jgi:hypothetical protein
MGNMGFIHFHIVDRFYCFIPFLLGFKPGSVQCIETSLPFSLTVDVIGGNMNGMVSSDDCGYDGFKMSEAAVPSFPSFPKIPFEQIPSRTAPSEVEFSIMLFKLEVLLVHKLKTLCDHCDRLREQIRMAAELPLSLVPTFGEYVILATKLLNAFIFRIPRSAFLFLIGNRHWPMSLVF